MSLVCDILVKFRDRSVVRIMGICVDEPLIGSGSRLTSKLYVN